MSKSDNGALAAQIVKGIVGAIGTLVLGVLSVRKGKKEYTNWNDNRNRKK